MDEGDGEQVRMPEAGGISGHTHTRIVGYIINLP